MIQIRHAEPDDYLACAHVYSQPKAAAGTLQVHLQSAEVWKKRLSSLAPNERVLLAIVGGEVVGNLGLHPVPNPRRQHAAWLGMAVRDDKHGRGIGQAMLSAGLDLADNWMQLLRIELTVYTDNAAAQHLYRKHGFVLEGTHRGYSLRNGQYVDVHAMARLHPRPPVIGAWAPAASENRNT